MSNSLDQALDELQKGKRKGPECRMGSLLRELPPKTAEKLLARIDDKEVATTQIADVLHGAGHPVSIHAIRRHRNRGTSGGCICK